MRHPGAVALCLLLLSPAALAQSLAQDAEGTQARDLKKLSIEELTQVEVVSVSRRTEVLSNTAAAVSVIREVDIRRSGAVILAEALRLGGAVDVARVSGSTWGISIRGFNISTANKLLVLIDGRSTYSGLFGGTFWDVQDALLPDLDRIEVIRGPGGTIWGANAVNGIINIISKPAAETQGTVLTLIGGVNERAVVSARHGGRAGRGHYRVYGKYRMRDAQVTPSGKSAEDEIKFGQGGFRIDSERTPASTWSISGAAYRGTNGVADGPDTDVSGGHLLGRWIRRAGSSDALTVQAYFDRSYRRVPAQFEGTKNLAEVDVQQQLERGRHLLVLGGTGRITRANDVGSGRLRFEPQVRTGWTVTAFAQDEFMVSPERVYVTAGAKLGRNNFTGFDVMPNVRLRVHPAPRQMVWAAVSRAVRLPTRFDEDLRLIDPERGSVLLRGSDTFEPESVVAYEAGYRVIPRSWLSLDGAVFLNHYDRLRSQEVRLEPGPVTVLENKLNARTRGVELAATVQPMPTWRLHGSYTWLRKRVSFDPGSTDRTGGASEGNDPSHLVSARSYIDLPRDLSLDAMFRFVGRRPAPPVEAYAELDLRFGWAVRPDWELSLVGQNLLHDRHAELLSTSAPTMFPRSVFLRSIWTF